MPRTRESWNKRLGKKFHKSTVKTVLAESAGATASTLNSVSESTHSTSNSVALSRAIKKMNDIDFSINIDEQIEAPLIDYIGRIEAYNNHRLRDDHSIIDLDEAQWREVGLAAKWALQVHKIKESSPDTILISGSISGDARTFCMHTERSGGNTTLVIAFRATRYPLFTPMEMAVNTNAEAIDCEELGKGIQCHRGLFRLAKNMEPSVATELERMLTNDSAGEVSVLFTGHSSGAAIAQLLFAFTHSENSLLARFRSGYMVKNIDCVTFGGPPIVTQPIARPLTMVSLFLSFVNEGDPISLAQESYIDSLIRAWTQPVELVTDPITGVVINPIWKLPTQFYIPSGDQVVLRCDIDEDGRIEQVSPLHVDVTALEKVLFGDLVMHSMSIYNDRIGKTLRQFLISDDPFHDP